MTTSHRPGLYLRLGEYISIWEPLLIDDDVGTPLRGCLRPLSQHHSSMLPSCTQCTEKNQFPVYVYLCFQYTFCRFCLEKQGCAQTIGSPFTARYHISYNDRMNFTKTGLGCFSILRFFSLVPTLCHVAFALLHSFS